MNYLVKTGYGLVNWGMSYVTGSSQSTQKNDAAALFKSCSDAMDGLVAKNYTRWNNSLKFSYENKDYWTWVNTSGNDPIYLIQDQDGIDSEGKGGFAFSYNRTTGEVWKHRNPDAVLTQEDVDALSKVLAAWTPPVLMEKFQNEYNNQRSAVSDIIKGTAPISDNFTTEASILAQRIADIRARAFMQAFLPRVGAKIEFISPPQKEIPNEVPRSVAGTLKPTIFSWEATSGVQGDIQKDGERTDDSTVIYGVASQFNGCEAPSTYTVKPGEAVSTYSDDRTQGPQAQIQFPNEQVELLNAAGNIGTNGLVHVLDESTRDAIRHGYLIPTTDEQAQKVFGQLRENGHKAQYISVSNVPANGKKPVHQILVAAPATGYNRNRINDETHRKMEYAAALLGFRAQFAHALNIAQTTDKPVVLKAVAVGLGVFSNDPETVAKAFHQAGMEIQDEPKSDFLKVRFQVYQGTDPRALRVAEVCGLVKSAGNQL